MPSAVMIRDVTSALEIALEAPTGLSLVPRMRLLLLLLLLLAWHARCSGATGPVTLPIRVSVPAVVVASSQPMSAFCIF
jgi:hypothetical protein